MSDNHEVEQGSNPSSEPELIDDLFLSPDDSDGEEIVAAELESAEPEPAPAEAEPAPATDPRESDAYKELEAERDDFRNRMMRTAADLENFRKRTAREKDDMRKYGIDRVVLELLPVLDNLDRALDHAGKSEESTTIVDGVRMVQRQFVTALEKHGVKGFDAKGEDFDPQKHEAIQQVDTTDHPTGFVIDEYQKGYYLHERLIRPALVVVARNSGGADDSASAVVETDAPEVADAVEEPVEEVAASESDSDPSDGTEEPTVN